MTKMYKFQKVIGTIQPRARKSFCIRIRLASVKYFVNYFGRCNKLPASFGESFFFSRVPNKDSNKHCRVYSVYTRSDISSIRLRPKQQHPVSRSRPIRFEPVEMAVAIKLPYGYIYIICMTISRRLDSHKIQVYRSQRHLLFIYACSRTKKNKISCR